MKNENENFIVENKNRPKLGDANYDPLRLDKTKIPLPGKKERGVVAFYIALKMIECFKYLPWMGLSDVVGPNGERINSNGEIYMPKFRRK